jgi:site-specific DNA recombinase
MSWGPTTPLKAMAVAIYVRVSTEEQRERQSIRTQLEFGERYCALHNLPVFRIYSDDGVTGTIPLERRPEGSQILADAKEGKFKQLLVYRLDRLGRDTRLILNAVAEFEKLGVRISSMTEEFDTGTATGRLMLTLLSGFASHERDVIRERSVAGTFRVAEAGVWLGGIVPYGYRKVGEKRNARLVVCEDTIAGAGMSEADVIREVFRMAAAEKKSCCVIADRLNQLRVPCAYTRDDRLLLHGKRKQKTSGLWRPSRIRGLLINKTYMGIHEFGKRSTTKRQVVARPVPAIVDVATWEKAQKTLAANFLFSARSARHRYLLRGIIKCGLCGLTYIGIPSNSHNGRGESYYRCNGVHSRGLYGKIGQKCPSKSVRGDHLEKLVWSDIEGFLRDPGPVLQQLRAKLETDSTETDKLKARERRLEGLLAAKANERSRVVGLYRRGRLTDADLDQQMNEIGQEEVGLQAQLEEIQGRMRSAGSISTNLGSAEKLLAKLRQRLDKPVSWECKRQLVEVLVSGIRVDTVETCGVVQPKVTITYRFEKPNELERAVPKETFLRSAIRIPINPETVGDHLRLRRLRLKLLQKQLAERLGVNTATVHNWECNFSEPGFEYMPAIIEFLGYNPLPPANTLAERLVRGRMSVGLSQEEAAHRMGVDPSTLAKWERSEREPAGDFAARVMRFLAKAEDTKREPGREAKAAVIIGDVRQLA